LVRVGRAPHGVHRGAGGGVGALIDAVGYAVAVRIARAALLVDVHSGRCVGTLIDAVRHAVRVRVAGTAARIDGGAGGRVGALVEPVVHAVLVGVRGAATRGVRKMRAPAPPWIPLSVKRYGARVPKSSSEDRKSTRLNSSHVASSYAVFCLKKKK